MQNNCVINIKSKGQLFPEFSGQLKHELKCQQE